MKTKSMNTCLQPTFWMKVALGLLSFAMVACGQGEGYRAARSSANTAGVVGAAGGVSGSCSAVAGTVGRIFDDAEMASAGSFEERVKGLISGDYDPQYIGSISGAHAATATCVLFTGTLKLDSAGQVVPSASSLSIQIHDSYMAKLGSDGKPFGAYPIGFAQAQSSRVLADGSLEVVFSDNVGSLTLRGVVVQNQFVGKIYYANNTHFNQQAPASGPLGAFAIDKTSFLK